MALKVFENFIDWSQLMKEPTLVSRLQEECRYERLSWQTVEQMERFIRWDELSQNPHLLDEFTLHQFCHRFDWEPILKRKKISIDFMRNHAATLSNHWDTISKYQVLTPEFVLEWADFLDLELVCVYQTLDENVIRKLQKRLNMQKVLKHQNLSPEFRQEIAITAAQSPNEATV